MVASKANIRRQVRYAGITNIELQVDASGLATGVNNSFGEVDGSNNIVSLKSGSRAGATGLDFSVVGSGVTFDPTTKSIAFNGSGRLRSTGAASLFNFLSYHASGYASIKWTAYIVCKIGNTYRPTGGIEYGLFGNGAGSSVNKGASLRYSNTTTNNDALVSIVTKGTATQFLGSILVGGAGLSNQFCVIAVQFDGAAVSSGRMRLFVNDQAILNIPQLQNNGTPVNTPTYALELGGVGNGTSPMVGNISEVILTSDAPVYETTVTVIRQLMNKHNIVRTRTSDYLNSSLVPEIFSISSGSVGLTYHLSGVISQDPTNRQRVFSAYAEGGVHGYSSVKKLVGRTSLVKAAAHVNAFGTQGDIYDPASSDAIQDCGGGFDNNGVMHVFVDVWNSSSNGSQVAARHLYSSDLSSWTNTDITAAIAADGLNKYRMYGNMIHVGGVWLKGYYKATDQNDVTQSANYVLRSTDGVNWTSITVRAVGSDYINEPTVFWAGGNNVGYIARNEVTGEWSISMSSDLGLTWGAFQDLSLGETVVSANPCMAKSFMHNGVLVNAVYVTNRNDDSTYVVYGKASDIVSDPVNGWNLNTKLRWWKSGLAPFHYHYGDVAHLDDTLRAVGLYTYDQYPPSGAATTSIMHYTVMPTWHVSNIEAELGI